MSGVGLLVCHVVAKLLPLKGRPGGLPYLAALVLASTCFSQDFTQRGFFETTLFGYPQTALNDSGQGVAEGLLRYEASYKLLPGLRFAGAIEGQTDTHRQTDRGLRFNWFDRTGRGQADRRSRQAAHPMGQGRRPQSHRPLRAPRLPERS